MYLAPTLTKKLFANMKKGYAGDIVPLLPAMLAGAAIDQGEGSAQPAEPHHTPIDPILSTTYSITYSITISSITTTSFTTSFTTSITTSFFTT
ncbi:hypothetical protein Tco_0353825 [Tanacetum coccineum]